MFLPAARVGFFQGGTPELALATLLDTGISTSTGTDVSLDAAVTVSVGDFLALAVGSRQGSTKAHASVTPATWACAFTKQSEHEQEDTTAGSFLRISWWTGIVTTAGTGNLTAVTGANSFQRGLILLRAPGGASVAQTAAGGSETGTGNSIAWSATPNAAGLSLAAGIQEGNTATPTLAGHALVSGSLIDSNSNFAMRAWQKLLSPPDPLVFSSSLNDRGRAFAAVNVIA